MGDNGAGKTAFLEVIYLVLGNSAENHAKVLAWRGGSREGLISFTNEQITDGSLWADLFGPAREATRGPTRFRLQCAMFILWSCSVAILRGHAAIGGVRVFAGDRLVF